MTDAGEPRPIVQVMDYGSNLVRYNCMGTNNLNYSWGFIPSYRGTLVGGSYSGQYIMIQWVSAQLRVGSFVTTTSNCGTGSASGF